MTSLNVLFCPANSPKLRNIQFTVTYDKEKHQTITFEKLEPENRCLKMIKMMIHLSKKDYSPVDRLIIAALIKRATFINVQCVSKNHTKIVTGYYSK